MYNKSGLNLNARHVPQTQKLSFLDACLHQHDLPSLTTIQCNAVTDSPCQTSQQFEDEFWMQTESGHYLKTASRCAQQKINRKRWLAGSEQKTLNCLKRRTRVARKDKAKISFSLMDDVSCVEQTRCFSSRLHWWISCRKDTVGNA